jgi:hypothetical protein
MTMPAALSAFFENLTNPVTGTEGVRQIVLLLLALGVVQLSMEQQLLIISSVSGVLSLFTRNSTVSTKRVDQKVDELVAHREVMGTTGTGSGMNWPKQPPADASGI